MKVAKVTAYGGPETIVFDDVPEPVPAKGKVLVRVHAAPVTAGDMRIRSGKVPRGFAMILRLAFGWNRPRNPVQGWSFSGEVAGLGPGVSGFRIGQAVFGLSGVKGGAHGEYVAVSADKVLPLPDGMTHEDGAAFFFGGLTALAIFHGRASPAPGQSILINGATGSVGSAVMQMARAQRFVITAVCSAGSRDLALRLGAAHVVDYRSDAPVGTFDVIVDVIGTLPWPRAKHLLAPGGRLFLVSGDLMQTLGAAFRPRRGKGRRVSAVISSESPESMAQLIALHASGTYHPLVGEVFAFDQIRAAHARAETLSKPGTIILKIV